MAVTLVVCPDRRIVPIMGDWRNESPEDLGVLADAPRAEVVTVCSGLQHAVEVALFVRALIGPVQRAESKGGADAS